MAVGVVLNFEGATLDQYDQVIKLMGLTPGLPPIGGHLRRARAHRYLNGMRITTPPITSPSLKSLRGLSAWPLWQLTQAGEIATSA